MLFLSSVDSHLSSEETASLGLDKGRENILVSEGSTELLLHLVTIGYDMYEEPV